MILIKEDTPINAFLAYTIARNEGEAKFEIYCKDRNFRDELKRILSDQEYRKRIETKNGNLIVEL